MCDSSRCDPVQMKGPENPRTNPTLCLSVSLPLSLPPPPSSLFLSTSESQGGILSV